MRRPDGHEIPEPYAVFVQDYLTTLRSGTEFTTPQDVADAVWRAVTEPDAPMKTPPARMRSDGFAKRVHP
ncbi:hypothetical protein HFN88_34620 [Rhizobium laguerreae]|uniref:hypothetical protein n=1 Tax=Rhizobium laguerreae TaxID=1076926 RepID=UPI002A2F3B78|nr:hypothetical protein [Rhizobium laguerreae]MBY3397736.1 hypothetical protein [Rhizobium laguerreae]